MKPQRVWGRPAPTGWPTTIAYGSVSQRWRSRTSPGAKPTPSPSGQIWQRSPKLARVETALLVSNAPLTARKLAQIATLADTSEAHELIQELNAAYDAGGSPFRVERVATGYQLLTRPEYAMWLGRLHQRQAQLKLTPAALETVTILAYRQPMTRADLEAIRGVQCADILKLLMDRGLVRIAGEDPSLGRPFLYETTRRFLELYGLRSVDDLPDIGLARPQRPSDTLPEAA